MILGRLLAPPPPSVRAACFQSSGQSAADRWRSPTDRQLICILCRLLRPRPIFFQSGAKFQSKRLKVVPHKTCPSSAGEKCHSFQLESNSFEWEFQAVRVRMKQVHSFKFDQSVGPIFHGRPSLSPHKSRDFEFKKKRRHFFSKKSTSDEKEEDAPGFLVVRQEIGG